MAAISASVFGSFWIALGLTILLADVRAFRRAGPLRRKRSTVADLREGAPAKLVGIVRLAADQAVAPLTGRACAGWQLRTARRRFLRWREVDATSEGHGFYLDDGTGEVFVPGSSATHLDLGLAARQRLSKSGRGPRRLRERLAELVATTPRRHAYRCDERALVDGMRVAVYGVFHAEPDRRPGEARSYRGREFCFVAEPDADGGVHVSDDRATLG